MKTSVHAFLKKKVTHWRYTVVYGLIRWLVTSNYAEEKLNVLGRYPDGTVIGYNFFIETKQHERQRLSEFDKIKRSFRRQPTV